MSKVIKEELDALNASLKVIIDKESYSGRFESALKKYQQKSQIRGFRKGKAPSGYLKKAYGPAILADIVNEMLQEEISNYLSNDKETDYLGHPLPSPLQAPVSFDPDQAGDYEFIFDIGQMPPFEIKGLDQETVVERYTAVISDEEVEKDLLAIRRRSASMEEVEDGVMQEEDLLNIHAEELEDGKHKHGGVHHHFSLRLTDDLEPGFKAELMQKKPGETFQFNPFAINKESDPAFVRRQYLGLDENSEQEVGHEFEGRIEGIRRQNLPAVDQAFFDSYFGEGVVQSEEEAKERLRTELSDYFDRRAEGLLHRALHKKILEANREQMALPEAFLKRWLRSNNEELSPEEIEKTFDRFADSLRWSLIRNKIIRSNNLDITEAEVRQEFAGRIQASVGMQLDPNIIAGVVERMMGDEKQIEKIADEIMEAKVFHTIRTLVQYSDKPLTFTELTEKEKEIYEAAQ